MNSKGESPAQKPGDPDFVGADAAKRARQRAKETAEAAAAAGGVEHELGEIHWINTGCDPGEQSPRKKE